MLEKLFAQAIRDYFKSQPDVQAVFLFGSVAKDTARPTSDIDLAVLLDSLPENSLNQRLRYMSQLSDLLEREVDISFLNEAGPVLSHQVLQYGQLLWEKNHHRTTDFKAKAMIEYVDWLPYKKRLDDAVLKHFRAA